MRYAGRRLLSTTPTKLTSVSTAHLEKFPPKESLYHPPVDGSPPKNFSPTVWASLQPPPPSALSAFAHRIGLSSILSSTNIIQRVCTHQSFLQLHDAYHPRDPKPRTNAQLATSGNALLGLFGAEYLHAAYPYLPTRVLMAAVSAYVGTSTCANVAREMGATPLLRWHRRSNTLTREAVLHADALASIPRALVALVYQNRSLLAARKFVHSYLLSREIDMRGMLKFTDPKKALSEMAAKFNRGKLKSRLLKETGRFSISPVFVVGIFSGPDKLGEGFGSSLRMAEYRAAEDALHRVYLTRTPDHLLQLPTSTFPSGTGDVFQEGTEGSYKAPPLVTAEIMYASSARSGKVMDKEAV